MIKKIFSVSLAFVLVFVLCACGENNGNLGGMNNSGASDAAPYLGNWIMTGVGGKIVFKEKGKCVWLGTVVEYVYDEEAGTITVDLPTSSYTFEFGEEYGVECLISKYITLTRETDYPAYHKAYAEEERDIVLEKFKLQDTPHIELGKEYSPIEGVTFTINKIWVVAAEPNDMDYKSDIFVEYTVTNNTGDYLMFTISGWYYFFLPIHGSSLWGMDEAPLESGATATRQAVLYNINPDPEHIMETAEFGFITIHTSVAGENTKYLLSTESMAGKS